MPSAEHVMCRCTITASLSTSFAQHSSCLSASKCPKQVWHGDILQIKGLLVILKFCPNDTSSRHTCCISIQPDSNLSARLYRSLLAVYNPCLLKMSHFAQYNLDLLSAWHQNGSDTHYSQALPFFTSYSSRNSVLCHLMSSSTICTSVCFRDKIDGVLLHCRARRLLRRRS